MAKVLLVDDEATSLEIQRKIIKDAGHDVTTVTSGEEALEKIHQFKYDVLLTDLNMPGIDGIELTRKALEIENEMIVILITAYATIKSAVEAIQIGAFDYLTKPVDREELLLSLSRGLERISLLHENLILKYKLENFTPADEFEDEYSTASKQVRSILTEAKKVAKSDSSILITGANGTGKEVLAKFIHKCSMRKDQQFVVVNCAAIPEQLLESELFGHVKGSFTGAIRDHKGYFEIADNGTIFLDEIAEIDPVLQIKLLRVLQEHEFSKVGDTRIQTTNIRIIAATNKDLNKSIEEGKFREDLYYRLNVFEFKLPSLKERPEDILYYFDKFLKEFSKSRKMNIPKVDDSFLDYIMKYDWPGNIRELKNLVERITILCENNKINLDLLPANILNSGKEKIISDDYNTNKEAIIKEFEINFIKKHLKIHKGNVAATAQAINFHPVSLRQKIAKLGIDPRDYKIR